MMINNLDAIRELAWEALNSSETLALHMISSDRIEHRNEWTEWYRRYDAEESAFWRSLALACKTAGIDPTSLIAMEKSFRRREKKLRWTHVFTMSFKNEKSYIRNIQA